ncbi:MAG: hypothetical protein U0Q18_07615 [Bryobacteraceae bacterium]
MCAKTAALAVVFAIAIFARGNEVKKPAETRGENESVVITATLYPNGDAVKELLGNDLGGHYIVLAVQVTPRFGKEVTVSRDDFQLKTDKNGERTTPFAPSQIAGRGALIVSEEGGSSSGGSIGNGPIIGGIPGTTTRPRRVGGDGTSLGSATAEGASSKSKSGAKDKPNPMLALLKEKELPEKKTDQPVSGLLYFPMEKQKPKDMELRYDLTGDKIVMRFHQER